MMLVNSVLAALVALVVNLQGASVEAFKWSSSVVDGSTLEVCSGGSALFYVPFTTKSNENVQHTGGDPARVHLTTDGFTVSNVNLSDSGNYTIIITIAVRESDHVSYVNYSQTRTLRVLQAPVISGFRLTASLTQRMQKLPPVGTTDGGAWHIVLSCGTFISMGYPPVDVFWMTPSGNVFNGSEQCAENGTCYMNVNVEDTSTRYTGQYACFVPAFRSVAIRCELFPNRFYAEVFITSAQVKHGWEAAQKAVQGAP